MIMQRVRTKDGKEWLVKRDFVGNDGVRRLRLRALDGGPLLFVEPDEVEVVAPDLVQPETPTGLTTVEVSTDGEDQGAAAADD